MLSVSSGAKAADLPEEYLIGAGHDKQSLGEYIYFRSESNLGISYNANGQTPLHLAASYSQAPLVEILCHQFPESINRQDDEGCTPLHLAARAHPTSPSLWPQKAAKKDLEDTATIEALLRAGADLYAIDKQGNTCLHYATAWGHLKIVRLLMSAGINPETANHSGWTPRSYSQTVQAEVYYRNLVAEFEKRQNEPSRHRDRGVMKGGGGVRLVSADDEDNAVETRSEDSRSQAGSGGSRTTASSDGGLGIINVGRAL